MSENKLLESIEHFKLPIALSLVGIVLIIGGIFASHLNQQQVKGVSSSQFPTESLVDNQKLISIDVSGAVNKPGVYQLKEGSRVEEAIEKAAGFSQAANKEYISKYLNLAQKLTDGTKIYIPSNGEATVSQSSSVQGGTKVNLNTATQAELEALPGIGPVTASKIISDRPFQSIEQLLEKKIISKAVYEKIKDSLSLY